MLISGSLIAAVTAIGFWTVRRGNSANLTLAHTSAFCILSYSQLFFSFSCRSQRYTLAELGLFTNRPLLVAIAVSCLLQWLAVGPAFSARIFKGEHIVGAEWFIILGLSLVPVTLIEVTKIALSAWNRSKSPQPQAPHA